MEAIRTICDAVERGTQIVRPYLKKVSVEYFTPEFARFKMKLYYHSGKSAVYYSFDYSEKIPGQTIRDEWNGMYKLIRLAKQKLDKHNSIKSVVIWATQDRAPKTSESTYDIQVYLKTKFKEQVNENVVFSPKGTLIIKP